MAGFGIGRTLSQAVREGERNVKPLLLQGEARNLSRDTLDRLGETSEALDALFDAVKTKVGDLEGLQEPADVIAFAIEFLAGVPMERASRATSRVHMPGKYRVEAAQLVRGPHGRRAVELGVTYARSRSFVECPAVRKRIV